MQIPDWLEPVVHEDGYVTVPAAGCVSPELAAAIGEALIVAARHRKKMGTRKKKRILRAAGARLQFKLPDADWTVLGDPEPKEAGSGEGYWVTAWIFVPKDKIDSLNEKVDKWEGKK